MHSLHPLRDLDQQHVAGGVPERVVDDLEPVDVEVQHADDRAVARARRRPPRSQRVDERGAVREAGQLVAQRLLLSWPLASRSCALASSLCSRSWSSLTTTA